MSVEIKISYNTSGELDGVIKMLSPAIKCYKVSENKKGRYKKAYAVLSSERLTKEII